MSEVVGSGAACGVTLSNTRKMAGRLVRPIVYQKETLTPAKPAFERNLHRCFKCSR
jgi:hypothetical protein